MAFKDNSREFKQSNEGWHFWNRHPNLLGLPIKQDWKIRWHEYKNTQQYAKYTYTRNKTNHTSNRQTNRKTRLAHSPRPGLSNYISTPESHKN